MGSLSSNTGVLKDRIINEYIPLIQEDRRLLIGLLSALSQRNAEHSVCVETQCNVIKLIIPQVNFAHQYSVSLLIPKKA